MTEQPNTILLVDDTEGTRYTVHRLLGKAGFLVWEAATGKDALRLAKKGPDLIILDVNLPDLSGLEVAARLKADAATASIPLLQLSASMIESESRSAGLEHGADGYMTFPVEPRELLAHVRALLRMRKAEREIARLLTAEQRHSERLQRVASAALTINAAGSVTRVLQVVTGEAREIVGSCQAVTSLQAAEGGGEAVSVWENGTVNEWVGERVKAGELFTGTRSPMPPATGSPLPLLPPPSGPEGPLSARVCRANQPMRINRQDGQVAWLAAPLIGRSGRNLGLIQLWSPSEGDFGESDEYVLVQLAQVAAVALENARLYDTLRQTDRLKDEFLAMLAHELRNPLAPILNAIHLLRLKGSDNPDIRWATDVAGRQMNQLTRLVDDLLDVSRISRGKIELRKEVVDLQAVVVQAVETSKPLLDARGHHLQVTMPSQPIRLEADRMRLAQVFWNLLNNAAKYTPAGGHVRLVVERGEGCLLETRQVVVRVSDTGVGIAPDMLPRVFDLFAQVERTLDRAEGGLGIGLTLVRRLTEMHGGTVAAFSGGPGRGSEFVVQLPVLPEDTLIGAEAKLAMAQSGQQNCQVVPPRRILVVDDNRDAALSLAMLLRLLGNDVRTAHDGHEALTVAEQYVPDLVLLDIGLPGLNGYAVAREIRARPSVNQATLVAMSGYGTAEDQERSLSAGFTAHLVKPVELASLQQLLTLPSQMV